MNKNFKAAASAVKSLNKGSNTLWGALGMFVVDMHYNASESGVTVPAVGTDIKGTFKKAEAEANAEMKVQMGKNSTYRVAKGVLVQAVALGISVLDEKGKVKGKTDLEAEIAAAKTPKAEIDKFKATMNTATSISEKLPASDRLIAAALVQELLKSVTEGLELKAAA